MVTLTVILVQNAETIPSPERLHQQLDPPLTANGYQQAQATWTQLIDDLIEQTPRTHNTDANNDGIVDPLRHMACFTAPFRSCQATALLLTASPLTNQDRLTWRYTTVEAASSPTAVPIITVNALATATTLLGCGASMQRVVQAGVLHTAAAPWNHTNDSTGKHKSPILQVVVEEMKATAQPYIRAWKQDRTVHPPRKVLEAQYLRLLLLDDDNDETGVWSLEPMTPKINLLVDMLQVNKYMVPPRKGKLTLKLSHDAEEDEEDAEKQQEEEEEDVAAIIGSTVYKARQVGCDTVFLVVPPPVIAAMHESVGGGAADSMNNVLVLLGHVDDSTATIRHWEPCDTVPPFPGPVDCLVPPPPDKDPASVPPNQWSLFPPPEPEVIPDDYPDLPPFGLALSSPPPPEVEWSDDESSVLSEDPAAVASAAPAEEESEASSVLSEVLSVLSEENPGAAATAAAATTAAASPPASPRPRGGAASSPKGRGASSTKSGRSPARGRGPSSPAGRAGRGPSSPAGRSGRGPSSPAGRTGRGPSSPAGRAGRGPSSPAARTGRGSSSPAARAGRGTASGRTGRGRASGRTTTTARGRGSPVKKMGTPVGSTVKKVPPSSPVQQTGKKVPKEGGSPKPPPSLTPPSSPRRVELVLSPKASGDCSAPSVTSPFRLPTKSLKSPRLR